MVHLVDVLEPHSARSSMKIAPQAVRVVLAAVASVAVGIVVPEPEPVYAQETWLTESDFQIGTALGDATLTTVGDLRVAKDGNRLYVLEPRISRVTLWAVTGSILLEIERPGQGPGDFAAPRRIWTDSAGFSVLDRRGIAFFTDEGVLRERVSRPPGTISWRGFGLRHELLLSDGSFLAVPQVPAAASAGWLGDDPITAVPILHVRSTCLAGQPTRWRWRINGTRAFTYDRKGRPPRSHGRTTPANLSAGAICCSLIRPRGAP